MLNPEDLEIKIYPFEKIVGMGVHNMGSGIQVLHKPTGIGIICTKERSQHRNKEIALELLEGLINGCSQEETR